MFYEPIAGILCQKNMCANHSDELEDKLKKIQKGNHNNIAASKTN